MEYVSIPWDNHRSGEPDEYEELTVNLALWFIHILAGNHPKVAWDYVDLASEKLTREYSVPILSPEIPHIEHSLEPPGELDQDPSQDPGSFSRKRRRAILDEDEIHYSFTENQLWANQVFIFRPHSGNVDRNLISSQHTVRRSGAHRLS